MTISNFDLGAGIIQRNVHTQHSKETNVSGIGSTEIFAAGDWIWNPINKVSLKTGLKISVFTTNGFTKLYPLPTLTITTTISPQCIINLHGGLYAQFAHKILESSMGLPTDFWITASKGFNPQHGPCLSATMSGRFLDGVFDYSISAYFRYINNMVDFTGCLFDMLNNSHDPLTDVVSGKCKSYGLAIMLKKNFGRLDGWVRYNYGHSRQRFAEHGSEWYPSSYDRTHDISVNASFRLSHSFSICGAWIYATGRPYTEPLYGYMIGENLICEYKPHNSSRLPDLKRLDLSSKWTFYSKDNLKQSLTLSVYNALCNDNVMFKTMRYTNAQGITRDEWCLSYIIPTLTYQINF